MVLVGSDASHVLTHEQPDEERRRWPRDPLVESFQGPFLVAWKKPTGNTRRLAAMLPITDAIGQDLVWIERGRPGWFEPNSHELGTEHELRLGDEVVARLRFQGGWPSEAEVDGRDCTL